MTCDTCSGGHWERSHFAGTPIFVHADGTREVYYECEACYEDEVELPAPTSRGLDRLAFTIGGMS